MTKRRAKTLSLFDIMEMYPTELDAMRYFEQQRWSDNLHCVKCGSIGQIKESKPANYWCGACRGYFNAFTNTPMGRSKVDPRKWILAGYLLMTSRKGISSLQLSKELSVQQTTAWYMLHRLRLACGESMEAVRLR